MTHSSQQPAKIILGIDPGTLAMGYSIIIASPKHIKVEEMDVLQLSKHKDHYERLHIINQKVTELIKLYKPRQCAIEAPFYGKNVQSMLKLGRAQGVAIASAMQAGLTVHEYSPKTIKQSITGNGNSDKEQVWKMLVHILNIDAYVAKYDISDALAVAVCHHFQDNALLKGIGGKMKGWEDFIAKNPDRIKTK